MDEKGAPYVEVGFDKHYVDLVKTTSRFWIVPPLSAKLGAGILQLDVTSLKSLLLGGIAFDNFGDQGSPVESHVTIPLCETEEAARCNSEPITLEFKNAQGLTKGLSQLRYLGVPVGIVENVAPVDGKVIVTARLKPGFEMLRRKGSAFAIVRPSVDVPKVSGLETLVSGIYIDCIPGGKGPETAHFEGISQDEAELIDYQDEGFDITLTTSASKIGVGTPVIYRGVRVGKITRKDLTPGGSGVRLTASVKHRYASLLHENSRFWNAGGVRISGGLISLNVQSSVLESKGLGGVEFSTPSGDAAGAQVKEGYSFDLYDSPKKEWLQWAIPPFK